MSERRCGRPKGERQTRERILAAASRLLAESGSLKDISLRRISSIADVNPAMVHYYFGGKEGLFRALCSGKPEEKFTELPICRYLETRRMLLNTKEGRVCFLDGLPEVIWQQFDGHDSAWQIKLALQALLGLSVGSMQKNMLRSRLRPDVAAFSEICRLITGRNDPDYAFCCFLTLILPIAVHAADPVRDGSFSPRCRLSENFERVLLNYCKKNLRKQFSCPDCPS